VICENKPYSYKSDVWSVGVVLYELTTLKQVLSVYCTNCESCGTKVQILTPEELAHFF
jgi:serine/threonine protein kinase